MSTTDNKDGRAINTQPLYNFVPVILAVLHERLFFSLEYLCQVNLWHEILFVVVILLRFFVDVPLRADGF